MKSQTKKYNSRDEFIEDDGLTTEEKTEILKNLLECLEMEEMGKWVIKFMI